MQMRKRGNRESDDESVIDADTGDDVVAEESVEAEQSIQDKLKKLRHELQACNTERQDNLTGWQRAKADLVNLRRTSDEDIEKARARGTGALAREILPALDSFESAMQGDGWQDVEESWRTGVERIHSQLNGALSRVGLVAYGEVGDRFDPSLHECMSVQGTENAKQDDTLAQVLQRGYQLGNEVVRPAKVVVYQK
jgi:molecular chaperone GrpE